MQIEDEGIIIGKTKYSESSLILCVFTKNHGIYKGLLKGGLTKSGNTLLQIGNIVEIKWRARLEEHLGIFNIEFKESYLKFFFNKPLELLCLTSIADLLQAVIPEREQNNDLYSLSKSIIISLASNKWLIYYIKWELYLLEQIGYGLDLSRCAVSGDVSDLFYVSPKTGKAVTKEVGEPYKNRLLILPDFLKPQSLSIIENSVRKLPNFSEISVVTITSNFPQHSSAIDITNALQLSSYFLNKFCHEHRRTMPLSRLNFFNKYLIEQSNSAK